MNEIRRGEIALAVLGSIVREKGIVHLRGEQVRLELSRLAKSTGIPFNELQHFGREIITQAVEEAFREDKVSRGN